MITRASGTQSAPSFFVSWRFHELTDGFENDPELSVVAFEASICRKRTNVRMIATFTLMARSLFRTVESIATPCS